MLGPQGCGGQVGRLKTFDGTTDVQTEDVHRDHVGQVAYCWFTGSPVVVWV